MEDSMVSLLRLSDRNIGLDRGMGIVSVHGEILYSVVIDAEGMPVETHPRERSGLASQLGAHLVEMIDIQMHVSAHPDELSGLEVCLLSEHQL